MILPDNKGLLKRWCDTNVSHNPGGYLQNSFIHRNTIITEKEQHTTIGENKYGSKNKKKGLC